MNVKKCKNILNLYFNLNVRYIFTGGFTVFDNFNEYKGLVKFLPDFSRQKYIPNQSVVPNFTSAIRNNLNNIIKFVQ